MEKGTFLIGSHQTRFGEHWDKNLRDLAREVVDGAIEHSPCTALDIDMVIVANMIGESASGQAHMGAMVASMLPHQPPALRVEAACASGSVAIHTACALLESSRAQTILVVGAEKMTDASADQIASALMGAADSDKDRPAGLTFPGIFGLVAQRYMHDYGLTREQLSYVSAVHHRQAMENPFAQFRMEVKPDAVSRSSPVADPLRLLDCSPISDGAAACILSTKFRSPFRVAASQLTTDTLSLADRASLTSFNATKTAMESAMREAGVTQEDITHVETHDCFSIAAVINMEDLGFAGEGDGIGIYRELYERPTTMGLQVNRSGGLKACGHPVAATGIKQFIDVAKQLKASGTRFGLSHNFGGAGATCGLHILEHLQ